MQTVRTSEELARRCGAKHWSARWRWSRPWARCTPGTWRWSRKPAQADQVVATIFVNPMQFGPSEDLGRYPRREEDDATAARGRRLRPAVAAERRGHLSRRALPPRVSVAGVSERWEGEARPGHFDGVATVVAKLLLAVRPDVALFGEKDFQQLAVIRRMVADLDFPVEIVGGADGARCRRPRSVVAQCLSVRRRAAAARWRCRARSKRRAQAIVGGQTGRRRAGAGQSRRSSDAGFSRIDYFALVDAEHAGAGRRRRAAEHAPDRRGDDRQRRG